ncbi:MAG: aminoacyl-tRNA hydrolase [Candidatus Delongbacteria bacterium]|nr:aminoacyl-tRNA hydrolase [Candidatus Delongbacteria bacterium]
MKYLIVGLGNPGPEYENTRHNIGYMVLDALANASNAVFSDKRYGFRTEIKHKSRKLVLVKPTTFMNISGNAVRYWLNKEKLDTDRLMVILDDIALDFGKIRIRSKGGDSGHNGLSHIIDVLGTNQFPRMRVGIGKDFPPGRQTDYVLGNMTAEEVKIFKEKKDTYIEAIQTFTVLGVERTMNFYNNK